ncbi:protein RRP5 homolog [Puntigrus tetrazona]|uniref:protein RRP5 homolog n=1 Tax=Puntigrus tetrazona TaxID=1606681 RepID=UPI001C8ADCAA|nr:protein RRP5 homolog [Puntigrus tetrazona]
MLGCVKQVTDFEAVVGFPSGLVGYLQICNICDAYSSILMDNLESEDQLKEVVPLAQLLTPGTLIRCVVLSLDSVKEGLISLKVSVNPKDVNKVLNSGSLKPGMTLSGCVESVEDHGFLVDIGISGTKAFLPKQSTSSKKDMNVGQYVTILLEEVKNDGRVVRLSQDPQALRKAFAVAQQGWTLDTLLPGLLIQGKIKRVTPHGLIVTYLSSFTGVVDFLHLDEDKASTYSAGDEVVARVLYVDPSTRHVGLSLRGHLLPPSGAVLDIASSERISEVVEGCKMTALHHQSGALMKMPDGTAAFVHKNLLKEASEEFNPNRLLTQPEHTLRIIDYSPVEQMHIGTLRRSTVEVEFFRYQDIKVGQILEGTVTYLQKYGAYVRITDHIRGFIPNIHLADVVLKNPEKLFTSGRQVKCRVLSVDAQQKKLCLTRKKALVESTLPLFLSYADAKVGRISHGYIVSVKDFGCIVRFYGDVKGLVPMQELSKDFVTNPEELFFVGQVVQAKVLTCTEEKNLLRLSFRAINEGDINEVQTADFQFEVGKTVEVKVYRKVLDGLEVSIVPEEVPAFIPTVHLSDHVTNCLPMWTVLEEGDTFSVTCLSKTKKGIILTRKPLLKASLEDGSMPKIFSELQVGLNMVGWVKSIMDYGLFIHFPYGLFGLAPKSVMCDEFITDTSNIFNIGQTVVAKVTNLDHENHRFLVSLKVSELSLLEEGSQARLVQGLKERKAIFDIRSDSELSGFSLGDKLKVTVGESKEDGTVTLTSDKLSEASVLVSKYHTEGVNVSPGCKLTALVLHVDLFKSEVHVTLLPELTGATKKKLEKGSKLSATIQFTDKDFAVVSLGDTGHLTIISTHLHINDVLNSKKFIVGSSLDVTVEEPSCEALGGLPLAEYQKENERKGRSTSTGVRELMTVKVKKVKPMEVTVTLPSGTTGSVHVSQISESPAVGSFPTSTLKIGSEVKARVIGARSVHTRKFLPFSHPDFSVSIPVLSLLPSITGSKGRNVKIEKLNFKPGDDVICFASKFDKELQCLDVHVKPNVMGTVDLLSMIKKPSHAQHPHTLFKVGQTISAKVVRLGTSKPFRLSLSLIGTYKLEPGMITMAKIWKIVPHMGMFLQLPFGNRGLVSVTDLSDEFTANPLEPYKLGQLVRCYIIEMKGVYFNASLRPSRLYRDHNKNITDPEIQSILDVKSGQIVRGYVTSFVNVGIFVRLSRAVTGRVVLRKATKYFVENEKPLSENIPVNFLVTAKVLSVNTKDEHVKLSLLTKDTGEPDILPESLELPLRQIRERELKKEQAQKGDEKATKRKQVNSDSQQQDDETDGQTIKKKKVTQEKQEHDEEAPDMKQVNPGSQQQDDETDGQTIKKKKVPQKKQEHDEEATNMKQVNPGSQQQDNETNGQTIKKKKVPQKKQEHDEEAPKNSDSQQQDDETDGQTIKKKKVKQKKQEHDEEAPDMKQVNPGSQQQENETDGQTIKKKKNTEKKETLKRKLKRRIMTVV